MNFSVAKLALASAVLLLLSGCFSGGESLYKLPKAPEDYYDLQGAIDAVLDMGYEYSAPVSGNNRQAVRLVDLDGDGELEAVAFFKTEGDKPLRVYIFKKVNGEYKNVAVITGDGSAIDSIEYVQLDGQGNLEILVGWQVSDQITKALTAYSTDNYVIRELMVANYTEYRTLDLDNDTVPELVILRHDEVNKKGIAQIYNYIDGQFILDGEAPMSDGIETIKRIKTGELEPGIAALFVAGAFEKNGADIVTDIFAYRGREFVNVAMPEGSAVSNETIRYYTIYATDIDKDGVLELPRTERLPSYGTGDAIEYYIIHWYNITLDGRIVDKLVTYHNNADGWYLVLPEQWSENICISRADSVSGERALVFSKYNGENEPPLKLLTIYTQTGDNRHDRALLDGRFDLYTRADTIFCGRIADGVSDWNYSLDIEQVRSRFNIIRKEWASGLIN